MRFAAIGLDHRHIYHLVGGLLDAEVDCAGYSPDTTDARVLAGFRERFPDLVQRRRDDLLDDPSISIICCAAVPCDRAGIAIEAMLRGKDVMVDKPGVINWPQLKQVTEVVEQTGRIFSICFSERLIVPAAEVATKLIADNKIGRVLQTVGLGPHRLNRAIRPAWFFDPASYGGILVDIASHQIDQFLFFTGSDDAEVVASSVCNFATPEDPGFQDFGEVLLSSGHARGYLRVDWFTPDGLPSWGDGRLTILGTDGYIELRKYVDLEGRPGTDHLFMADKSGTRYIDCSRQELSYFRRFVADVRNRTETAMAQVHVLTVCRLALEAQQRAQEPGPGTGRTSAADNP